MLISLAAEYLGFEETNKEAQAVQEISGQIVECTEQILKINNKTRMLVGLIDGVKCPETGLDYSQLEAEENFIKKFCPREPSYDNLKINQIMVGSVISKEVRNPLSNLEEAKRCVRTGRLEQARKELLEISGLAGDCLKRMENTDMTGELLGADMESLKEGLEEIDALIDGSSEYLSDEVLAGLTEEVVQLEQYREVMAEEVCDLEAIKRTLIYDKNVLEQVISIINEADLSGDSETVQKQLSELEETIKKYSFEGLEFNYSSLGISYEDTSILDALSEFMENGLLAIVLPEGKSVSSASVPRLPDSASNVCGKTKDTSILTAGGNSATLLAKNIVYTEYVMDNFSSFADDDGRTVIDYEVEYIICGENTDKKNLTETVMRIAALRSGVNMVYLLTDSGKKSEAYSLAAAMAGATAMEPVIRLLQYAIMYAWAFAEGLSDVRRLFDGEKIELVKTKDTWNLSFDKLMSHDFTADSKSSKNGLDYEMFLRILLYMESDSIKAAYTMDLVEFFMIVNYDKKFRLKDYVYGMEISTAYRLKGLSDSYTEKSAYAY
ncbi:MAG: DUF5702 domain-containing protein [Butyrivibrio sp.]|nr:DUF5702 domain-containing protein [Butyrivibrio sp.]